MRFKIFHIAGARNYLSDRGSRFLSGVAGDDKGESSESTRKPDKTVGDKSTVKSHTASSAFQEYSLVDECPMARIFAYGATCPAFDADHKTDDIGDSDNFVAQSMCEVASILRISAGKQISVAMTVDKLVT